MMVVLHALRAWWRRDRLEDDLDAELRAHLEHEVEALVRRGIAPDEARHRARRALGRIDAVRADCRQTWGVALVDSWIQDVRYGLRVMTRAPGVSALIVITLGLGIAATTTVFSVVDAVLLRPLPFPDADRLVMIWDTNREQPRDRIGPTPGTMLDWRAQNQVFTGLAAWYAGEPVTLLGDGTAEKIQSAQVTTDFFTVLGRDALLGRTFYPEEVAREDRVVVVSYPLWQQRFGGRPEAIGAAVLLDGVTHEMVGVMPPDFALPNDEIGFWVPWDFQLSYAELPEVPRDHRFLRVVARLRPGTTLEQATANLGAIDAELSTRYPETNRGWRAEVVPLRDALVGDTRRALLVLLAAVIAVMLIACTNVTNVLLARAADRGHEMSLRLAVGAPRGRLVRQLVTESLVFAAGAGLVGIAGAWVALRLVPALAPEGVPLDGVGIDPRVLAFTIGLSTVTGIVFGLAPALHATGDGVASGVRDSGRTTTAGTGARAARHLLVVTEVAAALTLVVVAGLLIRSFVEITRTNLGFDAADALVLRVFPDAGAYDTREKRLAYFDALQTRLARLPGVVAVGAATGLPLNAFNNTPLSPYWAEGDPAPIGGGPEATVTMATDGFFDAMRIPLRAGRVFDARDHADAPPVVVINDTLARELWAGGAAVGRRLMLDYGRAGATPYEVVGVVGSTRSTALTTPPEPEVFMPHRQVPYVTMNVVVRTTGSAAALAPAARQEILALDRAQPVHSVTTLDGLVDTAGATHRFATVLLVTLAGLAVLLAVAGIYGVMGYLVSSRSSEFGVRLALGASPGGIVRLVMREGLLLVAAGLLLGVAAAVAVTRGLGALLFEVAPVDPASYGAAVVVLVAAGVLANYVPSRRAGRVSPMTALRAE